MNSLAQSGELLVTNRSLEFYKSGMFGKYLNLPGLTEIAVNRPGEIWLEVNGVWNSVVNPEITYIRCERFCQTLATYNGDHISDIKPLLSATLESGERVQAVCYPACERGTYSITIRVGGLKEQVQQSVNFLSLLSETIPLPKHRYQWASDRTELT